MPDYSNNSTPFGADSSTPPQDTAPKQALAKLNPVTGVPLAAFGGESANRPDVIHGGVDPSSLYHSFRRRWLLATCMGMLVGAIAGAAAFVAFPESSTATFQFYVRSENGTISGADVTTDTDFGIFCSTQQVLIKSRSVLERAINAPGIAQSTFFADIPQQDKKWAHLSEELEITFPQNSEIMFISLSGSEPIEELRMIVEAVSKAYEDEILVNEKIDRLKPREILSDSLARLNKDVLRKSEKIGQIRRDKGDTFVNYDGQIDPQIRIMMSRATSLQKNIDEKQAELALVKAEFDRQKRYLLNRQILEQRIEEAVGIMPEVLELNALIVQVKNALREFEFNSGSTQNNPAAEPLQRRLAFYNRELAQFTEQTKARMLEEHRRKPNVELQLLSQDYQQQNLQIRQKLAGDSRQFKELMATLREQTSSTLDIFMRQREIDGLHKVQASISERIQLVDIEAAAENRIKPLSIQTSDGINKTTRYALTGFAGLACFTLTCFGIAYLEFRNRHLNGPEQIDEGLGIRVIGTLPALSGRKALDRRHPVVAQLTESIDSVRTALMHESTNNRRQIVMVTSASEMEGRTTVASQLAASLARAGRRTLLIDGDLRRPALHNLFDLPLEDGLCEVLRAETDVADVIRPTHAEGLWLISAGYCDADSVHALATDQVQPIFDKLRADYDFIIIDAAPLLGLSDSLLFGQHCDGTILSVLRDYTSVPKIHKSSQLLKSVGIRLIGAVVNGVSSKADRRVTHLQAVTPKSEQKQLEQVEA